jgi:hypothetical protein
VFRFQSPIEKIAPENRRAMVPSPRGPSSGLAQIEPLEIARWQRWRRVLSYSRRLTIPAPRAGAPRSIVALNAGFAWFDVTPRSRLRLYCPVTLRAKITKLD